MIVVLNTNIVFSTIAKVNGTVGKAYFSIPSFAEYYAPDFLITELQLHKRKLLNLSALSETEYEISKTSVFSYINFVDIDSIPVVFLKETALLTKDIDFKDFKFIALTCFLDGILWTGGKILYKGLRRKGFMNVISTSEIVSTFGL